MTDDLGGEAMTMIGGDPHQRIMPHEQSDYIFAFNLTIPQEATKLIGG